MAGVGDSPQSFIEWLKKLKASIGIPEHLSAVGVTPEHIERLVEFANDDPCKDLNPRPVSRDDLQALYVTAIGS